MPSALDALLLTINGRFDAARSARVFPRHLAERGTGGFLLVQGRQRLPEPQKCVRRFRGGPEFGSDSKKGFRGVAIFLAREKTFTEPMLGIREQRIGRIFL